MSDKKPILMLGLPKGSLEESTRSLFAKAGWRITTDSRSYRPVIDDPELDGRFVRAQEVSRYVEHGFFDCGLTGLDWIQENGSDVVEVCDLVYSRASVGKSRWVLCVAEDSPVRVPKDLAGKRIATELVQTVKRYFESRKIPVTVEFSWGATEVKVPDLVDAIVDITETGSSLRANKLRIVDTLLETNPKLIANKNAWEDPVKRRDVYKRQRMGSMGAVNLVAIEEYSELKQRHDFLRTQSDDLARAKTELVAAIDEINQTSQRQFELTFNQVRKNFDFTFQTLFGGGRAAIELVQSEDVLESGIEIVVQPPGTRLKNISLLSGGQRTLTAVALLFALYLVKPSPFCLLDELDAPLDESNIGRFTDLLRKFVKDSQFIIITHNKRTVAAANAIYGVTMEERGVSKTVSMRFNHEHGEPEARHPATVADSVRGGLPLSPAPVETSA